VVWDTSDRPPRPDPWDAGTDNVRTWNLSFITGTDIQMADQLHNVWIARTRETLPILTVATHFQTELATSDWIVAHAEDSAVEKMEVSFFREHADGTVTTHGPYMVLVDWEDVAGSDPDNFAALAHFTTAILTGPDTMDARHGDFTSKVDNRVGQVIEVRRRMAGRMEVRVQYDSGARE